MITTNKNKFRKAFINISLVFNFRGITRLAVSFKYRSPKTLCHGNSRENEALEKMRRENSRENEKMRRQRSNSEKLVLGADTAFEGG